MGNSMRKLKCELAFKHQSYNLDLISGKATETLKSTSGKLQAQ